MTELTKGQAEALNRAVNCVIAASAAMMRADENDPTESLAMIGRKVILSMATIWTDYKHLDADVSILTNLLGKDYRLLAEDVPLVIERYLSETDK